MVFCANLPFPAVSCENLHLLSGNALFRRKSPRSAKISVNHRKPENFPFSLFLLVCPFPLESTQIPTMATHSFQDRAACCPESAPISESTPESNFWALWGGFPDPGSLAGARNLNHKWFDGLCNSILKAKDAIFCLQLEASCLQWSFTYICILELFFLTVGAFLLAVGARAELKGTK